MKVSSVKFPLYKNSNIKLCPKMQFDDKPYSNADTKLPIGFNTSYNISFGWNNPNRLVCDVDLETYHVLSEHTKERYRMLYKTFGINDLVDYSKLYNSSSKKSRYYRMNL